MATIDCCMIVATTQESVPRCIAITSGTKLGVEPQIETTDAVKLVIKGTLKAQKPETSTITGHKLTLTDNLTILELIEILQGGKLTRDENGKITGYTPPETGQEYKPVPFVLDAYSAQMSGAEIIGYEKVSYPGCTGSPVGLGNEDNVFRATEYTINSAPGGGKPPYTIEYVEALPVIDTDPAPTLGELTVTSIAGTSVGDTAITVTPVLTSGNSYRYKVAANPTLPEYGQVCSSGYSTWDGSADITAATGQKVLIIEVDAENKAQAAGIATVTAKA